MIREFKINNIYHMWIDVVGCGMRDVLFKVYDVKQSHGKNPEVWGRVVLAYNVDRFGEGIYSHAEHVRLTDTLLFYLGFEYAEPLPGLNASCHYVKYCTINGMPDMIQLIPKEDHFSFVRMKKEDGSFEVICKIEYLDELQDAIRETYHVELPIDLETMNHACLVEPFFPGLSSFVAARLEQQGCLYVGQICSILKIEKQLSDCDVEAILKYGVAHGFFKYQASMYGLYLEKL